MKLFSSLFFLLLSLATGAQSLNVSVEVTDASCQANGAVTVVVAGGSGDYRYTLTNDCGGNFPPQNTPSFTTLEPCTYAVMVEDRVTGETADLDFTVAGINDPLAAQVVFDGCAGTLLITGGNGPYEVSYVTGSDTSTFTTSESENPLPPLNGNDVSGTVIDACGNSRNFEGQGSATAIQNFSQEQTDSALVLTAGGGEPPYTFALNSAAGLFTNNSGIFPWQQVGCNATISISSACSGGELQDLNLELDLEMNWGCVSFADGYAEVILTPPGRGPYTYEILADGQTFTQTDSVFTNLPVNAETYSALVTDACGNTPNARMTITRYQVDLLNTADGCSDNEVAVRVDRQCSGEIFGPVEITCNNCPDPQVFSQAARGDTTFLTGQVPGSWDITIKDQCGDSTRCTDMVLLEALSACDSIVTSLVQILDCDNGTFSRRVIDEPTAVFTLEDDNGAVLESDNTTGRFTGINPGNYVVRSTSACGPQSVSVTVAAPSAIDPLFDFYPRFDRDASGNCQATYRMRLVQDGGPYVLTGGPDNQTYVDFNDFGQDNCSFYDNQPTLVPGTYTLTSFGVCGSVDFTLPEIEEPRIDSVAVRSTCPGGTRVEIFSTFRSNGAYRAWFLNQGIRIASSRSLGDYFYLDGQRYRGPDFIDGLPPGEYRLAIVPRFSEGFCPVDTFTFVLPEYEPVTLEVEGDILCDTSGTVPLRLFPRRGNGPYVVREIDCANPAAVLATYDVAVGEAADVPVVSIGTYCFVVEDICGITADFQVEVRGLAGNIDVFYDCSPALNLVTDTLPGTFRWFDANGVTLGSEASVTLPPPASDTEYTLEVDIGTCVLRETVPVRARQVLPSLEVLQPLSGEVVQCDQDTVVLIAATDTASVITWDDSFTGDTLVTQLSGVRRVVATNDLGCTTEGEVFVRRVNSPAPVIAPAPNYCFGDTLSLGISGQAADGAPLAAIEWSTGASAVDSIRISGTAFYGVSVTDADGCSAVDTFTFVEPGPLDYQLSVDSVSCFKAANGVLNVVGLSGGTPAITFDLNGETFLPGEPITGLGTGNYRFRATDSHGCFLDSLFRIGQPDSLSVFIGDDLLLPLGETFELPLATNADTVRLVEWFTANPLEEINQETVRITALQTDSITVRITDQLGCVAANSIRLTVDRGVPVYVPNAFSPNGDGVNDRFTIQGRQDQVLNVENFQVFDRWGNQYYGQSDLSANDFSRGWDGQLNGRQAPAGIYLWLAEVTLINGEKRSLKGEVLLIR